MRSEQQQQTLTEVMPKAVRLTCVRHAETKANRDGLLQGQLDIPLSDIGKEQATKLGKRIADLKFDYWFTSDLSRARETADIAASHNQAPPTEVHRNVLLRERSFGSLEGMPIKEFRQAAAKTKLPMSQFVPPNGESEEEVRKRAVKYFEFLLKELLKEEENDEKTTDEEKDELKVIMFSHGGFLREFFKHLHEIKPFPEDARSRISQVSPNTGIATFTIRQMSQDGEGTEWEVTEEEVQGDEKKYHLHIDVHSFHDADHLANSPKSAIAL